MTKNQNKPKLLFLTEFFPSNHNLIFTGGVEARTYYLSKLAQKDYQVKLIFSRSKKIAATPLSIFSRLTYMITSFFKALGTDFDLIEGSNTTVYLSAFLAGFVKAKPTIAWFPDVLGRDWFQFGKLVGLFGFILESIALKLPWTQVIALSQSTKEKLIKAGIKAEKITVAYGGIDLKEFKTKNPNKFKPFTIITIARLVKTKRIIDLVKAFKLVSKQNPDTQLIIIGQGPQKKQIKQLVNSLDLTKSVKILKSLSRTDLIKHLQQSHLFCLPSVVEGFGLVTIEALAAGIPAVISNLDVHQEITQKGQGVLFFKKTDPKDLSRKLLKMIKNEKLYQQKQLEVKNLVKLYTWDKIYLQTKKAYLKYSRSCSEPQ